MFDIKTIVTSLVVVLLVVFGAGLVGNQSELGGGSRFPNGISADSTSPTTGQIRGSTLTVTGATTLSGAVTYLEKTAAVTASTTVAQSGTTFYLSGAAATSTLPAVASSAGVVFTFVTSASMTGDNTIVSAEGDNLEGAVDVNSSIVTVDAADRIIFSAAAENIGDIVMVRSNGTSWFVEGTALTAAALASDG